MLLLFGLLGIAIGAFSWTVSPWFVALKQAAAEWLVERGIFWPLEADAPWWLLTHQEATGDLFSWLDGAAILAWIGGVALLLGGISYLCMRIAARLAGIDWRRLALTLTPLAGIGLFLGLSMMTATHLRAEGVSLSWLPGLRAALLAAGVLWSAWLGVRLLKLWGVAPSLAMLGTATSWRPAPFGLVSRGNTPARFLAAMVAAVPIALVAACWYPVFFVW